MKRLLPTRLALLLVMGSLGNVFAAAFCPHMPGHDCCLTKTASSQHSHQPMHDMAMDGMTNESMQMAGSEMQDMIEDDQSLLSRSLATNEEALTPTSEESLVTNTVGPLVDACTHCLSHSGIQNAPVSSVSVPDQSNRDPGAGPLPVSRFPARPETMLAQIGLAREHAPPGNNAPRHVLISVFLI